MADRVIIEPEFSVSAHEWDRLNVIANEIVDIIKERIAPNALSPVRNLAAEIARGLAIQFLKPYEKAFTGKYALDLVYTSPFTATGRRAPDTAP